MIKYQEALNALCDEDEMYKIAKGFSFDDDYTSEYDYEKAKEYCKNKIQELIDNYAWIPVEERLPVEKVNPYTNDYYVYPVIFKLCNVTDVKYYSFGKGHWYQNGEIMDKYVKAWMPLPEAYGGNQ